MANRKAIRVKVFDSSEYIEVTGEMLTNYESFARHGMCELFLKKCVLVCCFPTNISPFFEVLETLGLDPTQAASSYLFDQDNFQIPVDLFPVVIPHFLSASVYLKIIFNLHENSGFDMVNLTAQLCF